MELISQDVDITGRPVANVNISAQEIATIKDDCVVNYPISTPPESTEERIKALATKPDEEWIRLTRQEITDIKEAVNKCIQDLGEDNPILSTLSTELYDIWVLMNPS